MRVNNRTACLIISLALVAETNAQSGRAQARGFPGGIILLAGNSAIQKELCLSDIEKKKVVNVVDDFKAAVGEAAKGGRRNPHEIFQTKQASMEKFLPKLKEALSADQFNRIEQINLQIMGAAAFQDAEVIKALSISDEQKDKFKSVNSEFDAKRNEGFTGGTFNREVFEKMQESDKERGAKLKELLTKEQLERFAIMTGKEFDLSQIGMGASRRIAPKPAGGARGKRPQPKSE